MRRGELYNIAVFLSLDVQTEGVGQPECFRESSKESPGHLEKEDIPFLQEQPWHTFLYTPTLCLKAVKNYLCVIQPCYKNVYHLGQYEPHL